MGQHCVSSLRRLIPAGCPILKLALAAGIMADWLTHAICAPKGMGASLRASIFSGRLLVGCDIVCHLLPQAYMRIGLRMQSTCPRHRSAFARFYFLEKAVGWPRRVLSSFA